MPIYQGRYRLGNIWKQGPGVRGNTHCPFRGRGLPNPEPTQGAAAMTRQSLDILLVILIGLLILRAFILIIHSRQDDSNDSVPSTKRLMQELARHEKESDAGPYHPS